MNKLRLANQLIQDEGVRLHAYKDSLGFWTIGVGRLIDQRKGGGITEAEAMGLLDNDIERFWAELQKALPWVITAPEPVQEVLVNMAFNLGVQGLLGFRTTLGLLQVGNYAEAAAAMLDSKWANQVGDRAQRLAAMVRSCERGA